LSPITARLKKKDLQAEVAALPHEVEKSWEEVTEQPLLRALKEGSLSRERLGLYLRCWHRCLIEDNAGLAGLYYRHQALIRVDEKLEDWITVRIGDGLNKPVVGGVARCVRRVGAELGISEEDFLGARMIPEAVGYQGWVTKIYQDAPLTELMAFFVGDDLRKKTLDPLFADALVAHYGVSKEAVSGLHKEAKAASPKQTLRFVKRVALGPNTVLRSGWGLTYAATIQAGMYRLLLRGVMRYAA
jgi:hypothetical protein